VGGKHLKILDVVAEMADGWNYWGLERKVLAQRSEYLHTKCEQFGRRPGEITKSWAGALHNLFQNNESRSTILEEVKEELRSQTNHGTNYFIASFGSRAEAWCYEAFDEASKSLE
jgi:hypothetical protein